MFLATQAIRKNLSDIQVERISEMSFLGIKAILSTGSVRKVWTLKCPWGSLQKRVIK